MLRLFAAAFSLVGLLACAHVGPAPSEPFSIAVIPDTQNYVDYTKQKNAGFAIDSSELFIAQMRDVAGRTRAKGGDVAFVVSVGDVWQHQTEQIDADHRARGFEAIHNPVFAAALKVGEEARTIEIPKAIEGYRIVAATGVPFGVAPGNHDYDAMWSAAEFPPDLAKLRNGDRSQIRMVPEDLGMFHIGGLDNFRSAFGADTDFFRGKPWYVAHHKGGANSAQVFSAGGYEFLHFAIQMQAPDDVLEWMRGVMADHPGKPTIVSTHDYLSTQGERHPNPIVDLERLDPDHHNSAEELWQKLIRKHDQIFLVLCGHQHGQGRRVDANDAGHQVHQVLADYQDRGQTAIVAGQESDAFGGSPGVGDGWYRLMRFELGGDEPRIAVTTYSSHYETRSSDLDTYAEWYREHEQPKMSDAEFHAADEFVLPLPDFRERFGAPR